MPSNTQKVSQIKNKNRSVEEMRSDKNLIQAFDEFGRELFIEKRKWKEEMLPRMIRDNWENPDELYNILVGSLKDEFYSDLIEAAYQLHKIDSDQLRSTCLLGIILMKNGQYDEAEKILNEYLDHFTPVGIIYSNLAKIYAERGDRNLSKKTLWHALELDPNQSNAVEWWAAIHYEESKETGYLNALGKVASLKGSWRAKLWLARDALKKGKFNDAIIYYNNIIEPLQVIPADVMMQISGDLGNVGRNSDIINLLENRFDPNIHGILAGNNLIKAYFELKNEKEARIILNQLFSLNRPDWSDALNYWEEQIDQMSDKFETRESNKTPDVSTILLQWPIWCYKIKEAKSLLPKKEDISITIAFITSSFKSNASPPEHPEFKKPDRESELGRIIPLFLAEQLYMFTSLETVMLIPIISKEGSYIVSNAPWNFESLNIMAKGADSKYILNTHLDVTKNPWKLNLTLWSIESASIIEKINHSIDPHNIGNDVQQLSLRVIEMVAKHFDAKMISPPIDYSLPTDDKFTQYLEGLGQLLALTIATSQDADPTKMLYGERLIINFLLNLSLETPQSSICQLMFISSLAKNKTYGSKIYLEYKDKANKLLSKNSTSVKLEKILRKTMKSIYGKEGA